MSAPTLEKLEHLDGHALPDHTIVLSRPTILDTVSPQDTIAQVTEIAVDGAPAGDHYFKLTDLDKTQTAEGVMEVDATHDGNAVLRIVARGMFVDEPQVLGALTSAALTESGVEVAVIEPNSTNLTPEFLLEAGGKVVRATDRASSGPEIAFYSTPVDRINDHPVAA